MDRTRVLILGGYGFFGRRLAQRLVNDAQLEIFIGGRSSKKGEAFVRELSPCAAHVASCALDVDAPQFAAKLSELKPRVVVHTAGPFQGQDYRVASACIAAGAHYVDLADASEFVLGIRSLDGVARAAGVAVVSGASSVPALSSAVVDELATGMAVIEQIDIGISPGNRTERGLSTVQAVLSYCGRCIAIEGEDKVFGWCGTWRQGYPAPVGHRLLSPCDVPDLALLPSRYPGRPKVRFGAGLELTLLHRGMNVMAWLARNGWVGGGWERHAARLKRISELFRRFGTDSGAMHVCVRGRDDNNARCERRWVLVATKGDGPFVPTLASAALVTRFASGASPEPGARPCVGVLAASEILAQAQGLAIAVGEAGERSLFEEAMGSAYHRLNPAVRDFHDLTGAMELRGEVETAAPAGTLAFIFARLLGAPTGDSRGALRFQLRSQKHRQVWTRHFPTCRMESSLSLQRSGVVETLGAARLTFELQEVNGALVMALKSMRFFGIPCPKWLLPRIEAREQGFDNRVHFHVSASLPFVGQVTGYRGWLELPERP